ncbi:unnamed protein product [Nesidiocoris tenuis]|uniref:Uncharacterized protein n=1 Tax=Nesidiocoris tenuis TaxID=355587 RepID=A0A6H5HAZ1_9HEMI|nr:unnamed protein product [Nesidiocoris tenuis]
MSLAFEGVGIPLSGPEVMRTASGSHGGPPGHCRRKSLRFRFVWREERVRANTRLKKGPAFFSRLRKLKFKKKMNQRRALMKILRYQKLSEGGSFLQTTKPVLRAPRPFTCRPPAESAGAGRCRHPHSSVSYPRWAPSFVSEAAGASVVSHLREPHVVDVKYARTPKRRLRESRFLYNSSKKGCCVPKDRLLSLRISCTWDNLYAADTQWAAPGPNDLIADTPHPIFISNNSDRCSCFEFGRRFFASGQTAAAALRFPVHFPPTIPIVAYDSTIRSIEGNGKNSSREY